MARRKSDKVSEPRSPDAQELLPLAEDISVPDATSQIAPIEEAQVVDDAPADTAPDAGADPAPEPTPDPAPADPIAPRTPRARKSGAGWLVLGGALCAGLSFGVAQIVPQGWPIGGQSQQLETITTKLADLESRITAQPAPVDVTPQITALETRLQDGLQRLDALSTQMPQTDLLDEIQTIKDSISSITSDIAALKSAPSTAAANPEQLDALRAAAEAERAAFAASAEALRRDAEAQAAALQAEAEAKAQALQAQAEARAQDLLAQTQNAQRDGLLRNGILMLRAALETGAPLSPALDDLTAGNIDLPPDLRAAAEGVPTLAALQAEFPAAARSALAIARGTASGGDTLADRAAAFLLRQTEARSLVPRDGTDPDAVLSRAEAALRAGDLAVVLTELTALPEDVAAPLQDWRSAAQTRQNAQQALAELARAHAME